jgi:hypothetical protein
MNEFNLKRAPFGNGNGNGNGAAPFGNGSALAATDGLATLDSSELQPAIAARDWDCLFAAVIERLMLATGEQFASEHNAQGADTLVAVKTSVTECVESLVQLHDSMCYELKHRDQLVAEVERVRIALAQAHAQTEAAGTEARKMRDHRIALHDYECGFPNRNYLAGA